MFNQNTLLNKLKNNKVLIILLLILKINTYGQIVFEKGYFINNSDQKTDCLIKNVDWLNNPTQFQYKLSENEEIKTTNIDSVKEFSILNTSKFKRFKVNIDRSNRNLEGLSKDKDPIFEEATLFLKTIIEGNANLYYLEKYKLFFYNVNSPDVKQLIYKEYISNNKVKYNLTYRTQLWEDLKCSEITILDINKIEYKLDELKNLFTKYNNCTGSNFTNYAVKKERNAFNLNIKPGIRYASLSIENPMTNLYVDFEKDITFSIGIEAEYIFPFNKNKWSVIFEPTYQSFKSKDTHPVYSFEANYSSLELPIGIKYSLFLNNNSKLFLTGSLVIIDIPFNTYIGDLDVNTLINVNIGLGYNYNNRYSVELRYASKREMLRNYLSYSGDYSSFSFILGYTLF